MLKKLMLAALIAAVGLAVLGAGCTKYASKKTLGDLEQARMAAEAAEAKVAQLEADLQTLEQEKANKQARIDELNKELEACKARKPTR